MTDPTGTFVLRRAFLAEGNARLARVRSLTHTMLVEHDLMQTRNDPIAQFLPHPGYRLPAFAEWFAQTVQIQLFSENWWQRYLQRAYDSGLVAGGALVEKSSSAPSQPLPAVYGELARRELAGIAAALVQQVSRQAGLAGITKQKPQLIYRQVLAAIKKVGMARLAAFVNFMVVKLHNAARLEHFKAAGITHVGIVPEFREPAKPSRFLKHDHAVHDALSAQRKLAELTTSAEELLARQRRQREAAQARAAAELAAEQARVRAEIERQMAGAAIRISAPRAQLELRVAQARAGEEVATAKAATAAQEVEAKAAWEKVLAARKEARAAEYAATHAAKTATKKATPSAEATAEKAKTAAVGAQAKAVETEAQAVARLTVGTTLPARLLAIGAEYVNVLTAGDDLVCEICEDISEEGPYSLDEAQGLIPAHPNCRCAFVPAFENPDAINRELATAAE